MQRLDRAIALEKSWEQAYKSIRIGDQPNLFKGDFLAQAAGVSAHAGDQYYGN